MEISNWLLSSAGNIWSSSDLSVGESLTNLDAGTYRITPVSGGYERDTFVGWSSFYGEWWWELHIRLQKDNIIYQDYKLGSSDPFNSELDAFNAVNGSYIDIPVMEGGSLSFWIWDWDLRVVMGTPPLIMVGLPSMSHLFPNLQRFCS